jgi:hypothetical protein
MPTTVFSYPRLLAGVLSAAEIVAQIPSVMSNRHQALNIFLDLSVGFQWRLTPLTATF